MKKHDLALQKAVDSGDTDLGRYQMMTNMRTVLWFFVVAFDNLIIYTILILRFSRIFYPILMNINKS